MTGIKCTLLIKFRSPSENSFTHSLLVRVSRGDFNCYGYEYYYNTPPAANACPGMLLELIFALHFPALIASMQIWKLPNPSKCTF